MMEKCPICGEEETIYPVEFNYETQIEVYECVACGFKIKEKKCN